MSVDHSVRRVERVPLCKITADPALQMRRALDAGQVKRLRAAVSADPANGIKEPILPIPDGNGGYLLGDGYHRHLACQMERVPSILAVVLRGMTPLEQHIAIMEANTAHGTRWRRCEAVAAIVSGIKHRAFIYPPDHPLRELRGKVMSMAEIARMHAHALAYEQTDKGSASARQTIRTAAIKAACGDGILKAALDEMKR